MGSLHPHRFFLWIILAESLVAAGDSVTTAFSLNPPQSLQHSAHALNSAPVAGAAPMVGGVVTGDLQGRADAGDSNAAYTLGMRYFTGEQIARNRILAKHYLTRAAEAGDQRAMNMLGLMNDPLWSDDSSSKDVAAAVFWYRRAAQFGYEGALSNLSELKKRGYIQSVLENAPAQSGVAPAAVVAPPAPTPAAVVPPPSLAPEPAASEFVSSPLAASGNNSAAQPAPEPVQLSTRHDFVIPSPTSLPSAVQAAPRMDGRDVFKARSSSLVEIIGDGNYGSGVILGVLFNRPEDAVLRTAMQDLRVNYPFIASSGADSTSLPAGAFLVIISNAHVMEGTRVMEIGYGVDQRGQTLFKKNLAGVCFPTDSSVDLAIYFVPVETSELQMNGVISFAPLPTASVVPETGSRIFALANPERMARSIAQGLLSGLRPDLIQFDAPISKGSSGGALFDEYGNLLGIIFGYLNEAGAQNLNFAIPAERIRPLMLGAGSLCYRSAPAELLPEKSPQGTRQD